MTRRCWCGVRSQSPRVVPNVPFDIHESQAQWRLWSQWLNTLTTSKSKLLLLQASEFFQDSYLVKVLCGILGERLLSTDIKKNNSKCG